MTSTEHRDDTLLREGQAAGQVRDDVSAADVVEFVAAAPHDPVRRATYLMVMMTGLRAMR